MPDPLTPTPPPGGDLRHRLARLFAPEGFRGPVLTLLSGTAAAMAVAYLALFVLTRLYPPEAFGVLDYFTSLLSLFVTVSSLRYEDAVMQPEDDREAAGVLWLAMGLVLVTVALLCGVLPWREEVARLLGVPAIAPWLWLVPVALLAMRLGKMGELWLTRSRRFGTISGVQAAGTTTTAAVRVGAGTATASPGGLIGGFVAGHAVAAAVLTRRVWQQDGALVRSALSRRRLRGLARRYRRFALFSTPSALLSAFVARLPALLLPVFFSTAVLGLYGRAFAALFVPLSMVGGAVAQVFFVQAAEARRAETLAPFAGRVHARLVTIGLFPMLALVVAGPDVFEAAFGAPWREAGVYVRYVGPWLFLMSVASPLTRLFDVLERQRTELAMSLVLFAAQLAALYVGGRSGSVLYTLALLGAAGAATRALQIGVMLRLARVPLGTALRPYARYALFGLPGLALVAAAQTLGHPWLTTAAALLAGLGYAALVLWRDRLLAPR